MRVTGGIYRGRTVECPPGIIRPAMDRMRESVFAILGNLSDQSFLDLFTGSGIIGIEAASRGAEPVIFIEKDPGKRNIIRKNISIITTAARMHIMPAERYVKTAGMQFDYIFLDPPFNYAHKGNLLSMIENSKILKEGSTVILHYPGEENLPEHIGALRVDDERTYGRSIVRFYRLMEDTHSPEESS